MKQGYLFVHFKEKKTPDGEQVYFGLSSDGFNWRALNGGLPVLWSFKGDLGVRDMTVLRAKDGIYRIFATDLSLAYGMPGKYKNSWAEIVRHGSKSLMSWASKDLIHWDRQTRVTFPGAQFGCLWAPDILYDAKDDSYLLHWSSTSAGREEEGHAIWYSRTRDFETWSEPLILYQKPGNISIIDSAMYEEGGRYYLFIKSTRDPDGVTLLVGDHITGPFTPHPGFAMMPELTDARHYEAPTAFRLEDGRWCLLVDYFGVPGKGQGYVPFLADSLSDGRFTRATESFSFPYGFKHGTVLTLTAAEYDRLDKAGEFPELGG
jgi:hypothetical protein